MGREGDLKALGDLFDAMVRLVTVLGPPGMGKTRLATRFLLERNARRQDGVFCDLRDAASSRALHAALAGSLGTTLSAADSETTVEELGHALAARGECLVVLDNFEQLVPSAPATVARWLRVAAEVHFLVTSRRALRIEGEHVHDLGPLSLPRNDQDSESEALRLLCDRLQAEEPTFRRRGSQSRHLAEVVRRLEGIPLAIELAASQLTRMDATILLDRLPGRVLALRSGLQDVESRHSTLRVAVESAWGLLEPHERDAFQQLTVFRGGFGPTAAHAVIDLSTHAGPPEVDDVISALRSASFLRVAADTDLLRWDSYLVLWEFARDSLDDASDRIAAARVRHAKYFLEYARVNGTGLLTSAGVEARAALLRDFDNLRAAFALFASRPDLESRIAAADLACVLHAVLVDRRPAESVANLTMLLERSEDDASHDIRARLLVARAEASRATDNLAQAENDLRDAKYLVAEGDELLAEIELGLAFVRFFRGELSAAVRALRTSLRFAERGGNPHLTGYVHYTFALVLSEGFQDPASLKHARIAIALLRKTGDLRAEVYARVKGCGLHVYFGDADPSEELFDLWPSVNRLNNPRIETIWHQALGIHFLNQLRFDDAKGEFERSLDVARRSGLKKVQGYAKAGLAIALDGQGANREALISYEAAADTFSGVDDPRNQAAFLGLMSGLLARQNRIDEARETLDRARILLGRGEDASYRSVLSISEALIELGLAKRAIAEGDTAEWQHRLDEATRYVEAAGSGFRGHSRSKKGKRTVMGLSPAHRFALHIGQQELRRVQVRSTLSVWSDGSAFQIGGHPVVHLPKGRVIRSLLRGLAEQRKADPGRPMTNEDLLSHGWPGEKIRPDAAARRVHAIIYRLRKGGLDRVLLTTPDGGYLLDPIVPFTTVDPELPAPS